MKVGDATSLVDPKRVRSAREGRISGCLLGKPLEVLSSRRGPRGVEECLQGAGVAGGGAGDPAWSAAAWREDGGGFRGNFVGSGAVPQ